MKELYEGITNGIFSFMQAALRNNTPLYFIASVTNLNFSYLLRKESIDKANTCSKYRTPPCISLVDFEEVPDPKSLASITKVLSPRVDASKQTPAPVAPPPITTKS